METFSSILYAHARRYPQMTPQDGVKLLYQSVFGGGHMIPNPSAALARLQAEYDGLMETQTREPLTEPIGGGLVRLGLSALDVRTLPLEAVNAMFCTSANTHTGSTDAFQAGLTVLRQMCLEGKTPFAPDELDRYLTTYEQNGGGAVSHSDIYRQAYRPAYRIIKEEYVPYLAPIGEMFRLLQTGTSFTVAIDGMSGSGKSTLAALLSGLTGAPVIHMDDFFLPPEKRTAQRLAQAGGNVDYERFVAEVCPGLNSGDAFSYGVFDCSVMAVTEKREIPAYPCRIVEGSYAMHPQFGRYAGVSLFLHISPDTQMTRITARNGVKMAEKFKNIWIPMENRYFRELHVAERCRFVLRNE